MRLTMSDKKHLQLLALLLVALFSLQSRVADANPVRCVKEEREALLDFKQGLVDESGYLSSWGVKNDKKDCCGWTGVVCSNHTGNVIALRFGASLKGTISPSLRKLRHLSYLDLSWIDFSGSSIPKFIGSFTKLRYLNLAVCEFSGPIPHQLGNLSKLQHLDLHHNDLFSDGNIGSLSHLSSLTYLDLRGNNLNKSSDLLQVLDKLSSLRTLNLSGCNLSPVLPWSLSHLNFNTSLDTIDLSDNSLTSSIYPWLFNLSSNLISLDLENNNLQGPIPEAFQHMVSLEFLSLYGNKLEGEIPNVFWNMCSLHDLDLSDNNFKGQISGFIQNLSGGCTKRRLKRLFLYSNEMMGEIPDLTRFSSLQSLGLGNNYLTGTIPKSIGRLFNLECLDLGGNHLTGTIPKSIGCLFNLEYLFLGNNHLTGTIPKSIGRLFNLEYLFLGNNHLTGTIPKSIGRLFNLEYLDLEGNSLKGVISESHFSNLSKLQELDLAGNSLTLEFRNDWIPPFQLEIIKLASCKLGPHFPKWLQTQKKISWLDISNAGISDTIPNWFSDLPFRLSYLNFSHKQIKGVFPDLSLKFCTPSSGIDISSNYFEGPIPSLPSNVDFLNLSNNTFSGSISFLCTINGQNLEYLDLSSNQLSGMLPDCWMQLNNLRILNLANNGFSGKIPDTMGFLNNILTLSLHNNNFSGELPSLLKNCSQLRVLDLGKNAWSGKIPPWIGERFPDLTILSLTSNKFHGNIPLQFCHLSHVQILDLSLNNISGTIPKCFGDLTGMTQTMSAHPTIEYGYISIVNDPIGVINVFQNWYFDHAELTWKGSQYEYQMTLGLVRILDLSSNNLGGAVPEEITNLGGLVGLNLSRNSLTGHMPSKIGLLKSLDFLDLSRSQFFGEIPLSLSQINRLSVLDLSYNNFWGKIPSGTQLQSFDASVYAGNAKLCGLPLPNKCPGEEPTQDPAFTVGQENASTSNDEDQFTTFGFYVSAGLGFIIGFWGFWGTLLLKRSWRHAFFNFLTGVQDRLYVTAAVNIAKLQRRFSK